MGKSSRKKKPEGELYYMSIRGTIRKIYAVSDEDAIEKAKAIDPNASVGHLNKALSKEESKEIERESERVFNELLKMKMNEGSITGYPTSKLSDFTK